MPVGLLCFTEQEYLICTKECHLHLVFPQAAGALYIDAFKAKRAKSIFIYYVI